MKTLKNRKIGKMIPFVFEEFFKKPATTGYPFTKTKMPDNFRGKIKFDSSLCIGCKICMRDCPSDAIEIEKVQEKQFKARLHLDRCIYCCQCVESCPKKALSATPEFELAAFDRGKMFVDI